MRSSSASSLKVRKGHYALKAYPDPESVMGKLYKIFYTNRGKVVSFRDYPEYRSTVKLHAIHYLSNFYGCDLVNAGPGKYMLVGEWFGKVYIDYLVEGSKIN